MKKTIRYIVIGSANNPATKADGQHYGKLWKNGKLPENVKIRTIDVDFSV